MPSAALPLIGGALTLLTDNALGQELSPPAVFPMALGNTWVYTGTIRWTPAGSNDVLEKEIEWTMKIVDVMERHGLRAAVLEGHPADLAWYEEGRGRRRHLVVAIGEGETEQLYLLSDKRAVEVEQRLRAIGDSLIDLLQEYELFLDLPLSELKRFCDLNSRTRQDYLYCWVVESVELLDGLDVKGIDPGIPRTRYHVSHRTLFDHRVVEYVSDVGMTSYVYGHHGTVSEVDVRLSEAKLEPQ
ncbi:MAG: hypothetical protein KAI97_06455 [Gemmatimonadetes bacterium]|nr:hypothetical protein [Gemmatimonadota bacterium]